MTPWCSRRQIIKSSKHLYDGEVGSSIKYLGKAPASRGVSGLANQASGNETGCHQACQGSSYNLIARWLMSNVLTFRSRLSSRLCACHYTYTRFQTFWNTSKRSGLLLFLDSNRRLNSCPRHRDTSTRRVSTKWTTNIGGQSLVRALVEDQRSAGVMRVKRENESLLRFLRGYVCASCYGITLLAITRVVERSAFLLTFLRNENMFAVWIPRLSRQPAIPAYSTSEASEGKEDLFRVEILRVLANALDFAYFINIRDPFVNKTRIFQFAFYHDVKSLEIVHYLFDVCFLVCILKLLSFQHYVSGTTN